MKFLDGTHPKKYIIKGVLILSTYWWLLLRMVWPNSLVSRSLLPQLLHQASRWNDSCDVCSHNKHISPPWHGHVRQRPPMLYWGHPHKRTVLCGYHRFGTPISSGFLDMSDTFPCKSWWYWMNIGFTRAHYSATDTEAPICEWFNAIWMFNTCPLKAFSSRCLVSSCQSCDTSWPDLL